MRVLGLVMLAWLALVGYQALTLHVHDAGGMIGIAHLDHQASEADEQKDGQNGGHAGHNTNCWAHATCSPVSTATVDHTFRAETFSEVMAFDVIDYHSPAFPPVSPPPRA